MPGYSDLAPRLARTRWLMAVVLALSFYPSAPWAAHGGAENILPVAKGVYRLPFSAGTQVSVTRDHITHNAHNRTDMVGPSNTRIRAAADGIIEYIQDSFIVTCPSAASGFNCNNYVGPAGVANCCIRGSPGCNCRNNYVWMSHPNGEWTKYTHVLRNSVPNNLQVGSVVGAGTIIATQGDVGRATPGSSGDGSHLHFEVVLPDFLDTSIARGDPGYDPLGIDPANCAVCGVPDVPGDDAIVNNADRQNRIPYFCQLGLLQSGQSYTAVACDGACATVNAVSTGTIADGTTFHRQATSTITNDDGSFVVEGGAGAAWRAGTRVRLTPGFDARDGSYFSASTGSCDSPGN